MEMELQMQDAGLGAVENDVAATSDDQVEKGYPVLQYVIVRVR